MRSAQSPERLGVELLSHVGPSLAHKGYKVVAQGASGVTWRREASGKFVGGLIALGLMTIGGLTTLDAVSILIGVSALVGGGALFYLRRPATVRVALTLVAGGTQLEVTGWGPDADMTGEIVQTLVGHSPGTTQRPDQPPPGSLWGPRSGR